MSDDSIIEFLKERGIVGATTQHFVSTYSRTDDIRSSVWYHIYSGHEELGDYNIKALNDFLSSCEPGFGRTDFIQHGFNFQQAARAMIHKQLKFSYGACCLIQWLCPRPDFSRLFIDWSYERAADSSIDAPRTLKNKFFGICHSLPRIVKEKTSFQKGPFLFISPAIFTSIDKEFVPTYRLVSHITPAKNIVRRQQAKSRVVRNTRRRYTRNIDDSISFNSIVDPFTLDVPRSTFKPADPIAAYFFEGDALQYGDALAYCLNRLPCVLSERNEYARFICSHHIIFQSYLRDYETWDGVRELHESFVESYSPETRTVGNIDRFVEVAESCLPRQVTNFLINAFYNFNNYHFSNDTYLYDPDGFSGGESQVGTPIDPHDESIGWYESSDSEFDYNAHASTSRISFCKYCCEVVQSFPKNYRERCTVFPVNGHFRLDNHPVDLCVAFPLVSPVITHNFDGFVRGALNLFPSEAHGGVFSTIGSAIHGITNLAELGNCLSAMVKNIAETWKVVKDFASEYWPSLS